MLKKAYPLFYTSLYLRTLEHAHLSNIEALIQKFILPVRQNRNYPRKIKSKTFVSFNYRLA